MMPVIASTSSTPIGCSASISRLFADAASTASPPTASGCAGTPSRRRRWSPRSRSTSATRAAAKIAKQALAEGATIRDTVIALGHIERGDLTEAQLDEALDVEKHDDIMIIDDPTHVRSQYLTEDNLEHLVFGAVPDRRRPRPHDRGPRRRGRRAAAEAPRRSGPAPAASPPGWRRRCPAYGSRPSTSRPGSSS